MVGEAEVTVGGAASRSVWHLRLIAIAMNRGISRDDRSAARAPQYDLGQHLDFDYGTLFAGPKSSGCVSAVATLVGLAWSRIPVIRMRGNGFSLAPKSALASALAPMPFAPVCLKTSFALLIQSRLSQ
jgi:hypothetical protein